MGVRRLPTSKLRQELIDVFNGDCAYCDYPIEYATTSRVPVCIQKLNWDHFVPYSYLQANPAHNWLPTCARCNNLKGARMFSDYNECREWIKAEWDRRYWTVSWIPPVSILIDPEGWAVSFASFLATLERSESS